jgi:hypothetical protein
VTAETKYAVKKEKNLWIWIKMQIFSRIQECKNGPLKKKNKKIHVLKSWTVYIWRAEVQNSFMELI